MKHLENRKMDLSKFQYPKQLKEFCIKKALSIHLQEFCRPKRISDDNSLRFITTYNPNNPIFQETIEKSVECLKRSKKGGIEKPSVTKSKQQTPNFEKILAKAQFSEK